MRCSYSRVTSKYTSSHGHLRMGLTIFIQKPKIVMKCQTTVSLSTFSILMSLATSPHNSHKHLHFLHTAQIKTLRSVTLTHAASSLGKLHYSRNFLHSLLCSHNSHTSHCSEQNESNPPHLSTLLLKDPFQYYTLSYVYFFQEVLVPSGILSMPHYHDKALAVHPHQ